MENLMGKNGIDDLDGDCENNCLRFVFKFIYVTYKI